MSIQSFAIGVLTCDRVHFLEKCFNSIAAIDCPKIVGNNSINTLSKNHFGLKTEYFWNGATNSIAFGKNQIIKWFLQNTTAEYLFIIEDDIIVKDAAVFEKYIDTSVKTNFKHLMWSGAGTNNFVNGKLHPVLVVNVNDTMISFYRHAVGAFCVYHREVLEKVGLMDENFKNAFEHIAHSWEIALAGYIPTQFGFWPDIFSGNTQYLIDQDPDFSHSTAQNTHKSQWNDNVQSALKLFERRFGFHPYAKLEELNKLDKCNQITFDVIEQSNRIFKNESH
jgi:hypothetical protein